MAFTSVVFMFFLSLLTLAAQVVIGVWLRYETGFSLFCGLFNHGRSGQLLLALASTAILGSESDGTRDHILLSHDAGSREASVSLTTLSGD
jgi:hypothetical protein